MNAKTITLSTQLESPLLSDREAMKRILAVTVTVPQSARRSHRLPVNLALVIDRSGSMEGTKLTYVKQAAIHVLNLLREEDRVAVVAYDDKVRLLSTSLNLTGGQKEELKRKVNALRSGNSTALFDGWMTGAEQVAEHYLNRGVNRTLLLTDGLANVGESRPEVLARHAAELQQRGVATSTFGVGADFSQFVLEQMAERGGGQYHFIETPQQIPAIFERELNELLSIEARKATLTVMMPEGMDLRLIGDLPHTVEGRQLRIPMGDLSAGREINFYFEVNAQPQPMGRRLSLKLELTYTSPDGVEITEEALAVWAYAPHQEALSAPCDRALQEKAAVIQMAVAETEALRMADAGDFAGGALYLRCAQAAAAPALSPEMMQEYEQARYDLESGTMDKTAQKARHREMYRRRQSRE